MLSRRTLSVVLSLTLLTSAACEDEFGPAVTPGPWPTPGVALTWQWQLTGEIDLNTDAEVFELDAFTTGAYEVDRLRARGRRLICYLNAGAYEQSRPDADRFPADVIGAPTGTPGEWWLDIRQWDVLRPILRDRLRLCRGKGFEAVDLDRVDGYAAASGFPLSFDDQLRFNRRLAELARSLGLSPGLHNDLNQVVALEPDFDFAVNEECFALGQCDQLTPFIEADKAVFHVEYDVPTTDFCATTGPLGFSSIRKERDLGAWRLTCLR